MAKLVYLARHFVILYCVLLLGSQGVWVLQTRVTETRTTRPHALLYPFLLRFICRAFAEQQRSGGEGEIHPSINTLLRPNHGSSLPTNYLNGMRVTFLLRMIMMRLASYK